MKQSHETNSPSNIPGIENDKDYKMEKESVIDCSYSYWEIIALENIHTWVISSSINTYCFIPRALSIPYS